VPRFLLAQLHLDSLIEKRSPKAIRASLKRLSKGSEAYDQAYGEAMERIEDQIADSQKLAKQVLSWITCAKRPLTTAKLRHALAIEIGESEFDEENLPDIEAMVSVCAGLVTVDKESDIIHLVHYTTQEYFERTWISWFPNAQKDITTTYVTYLSFDAFEAGFCLTDKGFETRLQLNALYDYAARNWGYHVRAASAEVKQLILNFLGAKSKVSSSSQAMMAFRLSSDDSGYSQRVPRQMAGVHLAAYFGLKEIIIALLRNGHDPNVKDTYGRTPLSWAAWNGQEAVAKLLLAKDCVDPDAKDIYGRTPLSWAVENGHKEVVKLLLAMDGVDPDSKGRYGQTPLSWAAEQGQEAVVELLLAKDGVDPNVKDKYGRTPLSWGAWNGHEKVVKLLLAKNGVDPDFKDTRYGQSPLSWAAEKGHEAVVKLLLTQDSVDSDSKSNGGWTPLSQAAVNGHKAVVELLLAQDEVDPEPKSKGGWTPLSLAARQGHSDVVKLLLEKYKENGIVVHNEDVDFATHPAAEGRITCDNCLSKIPDFDTHYHCEICSEGDFDICQKCIVKRTFCFDSSHEMKKRTVKDGNLVEVPD
jgi:ankyrin repeat protein